MHRNRDRLIAAGRRIASAVALIALATAAAAAAPERKAAVDEASAVFAKVGDQTITVSEFEQALKSAARSRFYHGRIPDGEVPKLQRDVADRLVNELLLAREARKRGIKADTAGVKKRLDDFEARYRNTETWKEIGAQVLPELKRKLENESLVQQLEAQVRKVGAPTAKQLEAYYTAHKDKFTEPEQVKIGVILLKVDPSSPKAKWDAARDEGAAIVRRLNAGADFAQLAHLHSGDASATKGGDMEYLHRGMLADVAQEAIDKLQPGQVSEAVTLLEGVAVFRLVDRRPAKLNPLNVVHDRAQGLWQREKAEEAWTTLIARLRKETSISVDESRLLPLAAVSKAGK